MPLFWVTLKIFLLDVSIPGFFGSKKIEKADDNQIELIESCQLWKISFEFLELKFFIGNWEVSSHNEIAIGLCYNSKSIGQKISVCKEEQQEKKTERKQFHSTQQD